MAKQAAEFITLNPKEDYQKIKFSKDSKKILSDGQIDILSINSSEEG